MIGLEVGGGENPRKEDFEQLDIQPYKHINIVGSPWSIPRNKDYYDEIYSRHSFEHLTLQQAKDTLKEYLRILKPDGMLHLIMPNFEFCIKQLSMDGKSKFLQQYSQLKNITNKEHAMSGIFGWQRNEYDLHKWGWTRESLEKELISAGFSNILFLDQIECDLDVTADKILETKSK